LHRYPSLGTHNVFTPYVEYPQKQLVYYLILIRKAAGCNKRAFYAMLCTKKLDKKGIWILRRIFKERRFYKNLIGGVMENENWLLWELERGTSICRVGLRLHRTSSRAGNRR
jgi:hypothetical protein